MAKHTNYTKKAIEAAIRAGWDHEYLGPEFLREKSFKEWKNYTINHPHPKLFFLDPSFWQHLGKALNRTHTRSKWGHKNGVETTITSWWENAMHTFVDHLIACRSVESFFEELYHMKEGQIGEKPL